MDGSGVPRDVCAVPEKGNTKRHFETSLNLKKRIKVYSEYFRGQTKLDGSNAADTYVMNLRNPQTAAAPWGDKPHAALAVEANVTEVCVHPHAFRRTINPCVLG